MSRRLSRLSFCVALIFAISLMLSVSTADAETGGVTITNPQWLERPTGQDFASNYPGPALAQLVNGRVMLDCSVEATGRVSCVTIEEMPIGWGFGEAAVRISRAFRMSPRLEDGQPTSGARVRVPIVFRIGTPDQPSDEVPEDAWPLLSALALPNPPVWETAPSYSAVQAGYPERAKQQGIRGRAVLSCTINQDRTLACEDVRETPTGYGFLDAARLLAAQFRVADHSADMARPHEPFLLPINFGADVLDTPLSRLYSGAAPYPLPQPSLAVIRSLYPQEALQRGIEGEAYIICVLPGPGLEQTCRIANETPLGAGFGDAVLNWMMRLPLEAADWGLLPGDEVRVAAPFRLVEGER